MLGGLRFDFRNDHRLDLGLKLRTGSLHFRFYRRPDLRLRLGFGIRFNIGLDLRPYLGRGGFRRQVFPNAPCGVDQFGQDGASIFQHIEFRVANTLIFSGSAVILQIAGGAFDKHVFSGPFVR